MSPIYRRLHGCGPRFVCIWRETRIEVVFAFEELAFYSKEMKILGVYAAHPFRSTFDETAAS